MVDEIRRDPYGSNRRAVGATDETAQPELIGKGFQTFPKVRVDLSEARNGEGLGGDHAAELVGTHIWAEAASSPGAKMELEFNRKHPGNWNRHLFQEGLELETPGFRQIFIHNKAQAGEWIELAWYDAGEPRPETVKVIQNRIQAVQGVSVQKATSDGSGADVQNSTGPHDLVSSDNGRRGILFQAHPGNDTNIEVGPDGFGGGKSLILTPGQVEKVVQGGSGYTPGIDWAIPSPTGGGPNNNGQEIRYWEVMD